MSEPDKERAWFEAYGLGEITADELAAFERYLMDTPAARTRLRQYLHMDARLHELLEPQAEDLARPWLGTGAPRPARRALALGAAAAALAFALGLGSRALLDRTGAPGAPVTAVPPRAEATAEGFAVVRRLVNAEWPVGTSRQVGEAVGKETFRLTRGVAQIDFFSGATVLLEGPAELELRSASEAVLASGRLRAHVPPAARGFKVRSAATDVIDLGTEFGLDVSNGDTRVQVFDGSVSLSSGGQPHREIKAGRSWTVPRAGQPHEGPLEGTAYLDPRALNREYDEERRRRHAITRTWTGSFARTAQLIAYYDPSAPGGDERVADVKANGGGAFDGTIVLAQRVPGRWGDLDPAGALEFGRPGARARVHVTGDFRAFTFVCWVRIDALDRWYNALFMADGYENGEPHWQIRDDGLLMLSVMVDDKRPHPKTGEPFRFHRVYYSPPMWTAAKSGQWFHIVSVFDPVGRRVSHYVDGVEIHRQEIVPEYQVDRLRIGSAEIGNWGEPLRDEPRFAIRNLNGRIDELAVLDAAWTTAEVENHYRNTKGTH